MKTIRSLALIAAMTVPVFLAMPAHATEVFPNCDAAYAAGYSNIPSSDPHYSKNLDRDHDGIGCDNPPADFKPHQEAAAEQKASTVRGTKPSADDEDLAETGGSGATPYIAGAGAVMLAGGGYLAMRRKKVRG